MKPLIATEISSQLGFAIFLTLYYLLSTNSFSINYYNLLPSVKYSAHKGKNFTYVRIRTANLIKNDKVSCILYLDGINRG